MFSNYENPKLRGIEEPRPWNVQKEIARYCQPHYQALDVGCGTLFKWQPLKDRVRTLTGLDRNPNMRKNAETNLRKWRDSSVHLVHGDAHHLPFANSSFDLVTAIMAPCADEKEIFRVLKPGGVFFMETSTEMDQRNIKEAFGKDEQGWRGHNCDLAPGAVIRQRTENCEKWFGNCQIRHKHWRTWYPKENLSLFLEQVPIIRNYGKDGDDMIIKKMIAQSDSDKGFATWQDRILLIAQKPFSSRH